MIQIKHLDNSAENLRWFRWNTWMIQLKIFDDSVSRVSAESSNSFGWIIHKFRMSHPSVSAEPSHTVMVQLKHLDNSVETVWWISWITWMIPLKLLDDSVSRVSAESSNSFSWIIHKFQMNHPSVSAEPSKPVIQLKLLDISAKTL